MSAGPVNTFGMQKAHLNVERGPGYPTPGVLQKEAASCWKQRKRVQKRAQRDDKRLQNAENKRFDVETQRHRGRGDGFRVDPCGAGNYAQRDENGRDIDAACSEGRAKPTIL